MCVCALIRELMSGADTLKGVAEVLEHIDRTVQLDQPKS